ncbi:BZ3500_MvSof-1268-A1-R1_Chr9g10714 [Microbotryum saponariae]|uniref:BZ3500_MvSof-1268-A1-R1_Chr9g10714 protein n=1 Tax=Microbotryum saponariae TaxID=289078 RepID=A0A2X0LN96_9BASI|nr:BZ3501_MvSof-1269-A2-R1_Chr9g10462 [Microbotryum saponariae]SDA00573.1 BZ3500_MvSof-1268-A1-R1_Chr9g10714 [Microbotryum saponariae]
MTRIPLLVAATSLVAGSIAGAVYVEPSYVDVSRIQETLRQAQQKHQSALDNFHANELNHPEVLEQHQSLIRHAHRIERRARARARVEKRQSSGQGVVPMLDFSFVEPDAEPDPDAGGRMKWPIRPRYQSAGPLTHFPTQLYDRVYTNVSIGTPGQVFPILIDTGSADLWVYQEGVGQVATAEWDASKSTSVVTTPSIPWSIKYGSGSQQGFLNQDIVTMGGYSVDTVFAAATTLNQAFSPYPISGIFGFGFGVVAASGYSPWFERLMNQSIVANPYFSMFLVRASDITTVPQGSVGGAQLCIGCMDNAKFTGTISWNRVTSIAFWTIAMDGIALNGTVITGTEMNASFDSGTTLIQIPVAAAQAMYAQIGGVDSGTGDGTYNIPCDAPIGSLAFAVKGVQYEIPPEDLIRAISRDRSICVLTIAGVDNVDARGRPTAIVGGAFLKNVYAIYSYSYQGAPAVGLARSIIAGSWNFTSGSGESPANNLTIASTGSITVSQVGPVTSLATTDGGMVTSGGLGNAPSTTTTSSSSSSSSSSIASPTPTSMTPAAEVTVTSQPETTIFVTASAASPIPSATSRTSGVERRTFGSTGVGLLVLLGAGGLWVV